MSTPTFPLFPTFPLEIRLKIYSAIFSTPRTITITCNKEPWVRGKPRSARSFTSSKPPPPLLHVNRETRYEALNVYIPHFKHPLSPQATYLNVSIDTVEFADGVLPYVVKALPGELNVVQNMALQTKDCAYFGHYNMEILKNMQGLRELEITAMKGVVYSWSQQNDNVERVARAFEEARKEDPGWRCPRVRILDGEVGTLGTLIEEGALLPGWTEQTAHLFDNNNGA